MIATLVIGSRFKLRTCSRTWIDSPMCVLGENFVILAENFAINL